MTNNTFIVDYPQTNKIPANSTASVVINTTVAAVPPAACQLAFFNLAFNGTNEP
ncbi:hypothetical protein ACFWY5_53500 [Nonomuraea sp. NPDC059007]|uniref:hypothetical protein n=1 Tax=Nonomuraea sp. NPDC059007 TaxID=3346692 RepID=UPI00368DF3A0